MIPEKYIVGVLLSLYFVAAIGGLLAFNDVPIGRYVVYISVPLGAIVTIVASVLAVLGKIDKDR